jgi:hypothetical protein
VGVLEWRVRSYFGAEIGEEVEDGVKVSDGMDVAGGARLLLE